MSTEFHWLVENVPTMGERITLYHCTNAGDLDCVTPSHVEAGRYPKEKAEEIAARLGSTATGTWKAIEHGFTTTPREAVQAEPKEQQK